MSSKLQDSGFSGGGANKTSKIIGVLITTTGILSLVLGLVGASVEVYAQLLIAIAQQQLQQRLPGILQQQGEATTGREAGPSFEPTDVLAGLIESLISAPLWLVFTVVGVGLIYFGLYIAQRQVPDRRT